MVIDVGGDTTSLHSAAKRVGRLMAIATFHGHSGEIDAIGNLLRRQFDTTCPEALRVFAMTSSRGEHGCHVEGLREIGISLFQAFDHPLRLLEQLVRGRRYGDLRKANGGKTVLAGIWGVSEFGDAFSEADAGINGGSV